MASRVVTYLDATADLWRNHVDGEPIVGVWTTRGYAIEAGRRHAITTQAEHLVLNGDGTLAFRRCYDGDPVPLEQDDDADTA